ncbi:P-loop NTPase fold protein [Arthrobacter sp. efr-133-R2A-63]|uniref:KAP family P-loop NTPase fold protein n=1 Tax=Arthrobacter sp. efr-133-R2A-63 TaxID=3040278 RepID=UPI00254B6705|nr:P-loop NTPase fold protein [Arthrobacter sp. efr-133-R2A-63]
MWLDYETDRDFLNFEGDADTIAEVIASAAGRSQLECLVLGASASRQVVNDKLEAEAAKRETGLDKSPGILGTCQVVQAGQVDRVAGCIDGAWHSAHRIAWRNCRSCKRAGKVDGEDLEKAGTLASSTAAAGRALLNPKAEYSPPKEIRALRDSFEDALKEIGVTLVVLIDGLDRCMPGTTISTLEAIRLFLFLKNTAFVIAADDNMIKHAVKQHFQGLDDDELVTNYFHKVVQIPIRVPALGTQEVRAYLMVLFMGRLVKKWYIQR